MDPLHFCIAIVPVSVYLLVVGIINLSPRPFLTTGGRDLSALALAVSGFVIAGPMELFLPEAVASILKGWVWVPLLLLYALLVILVVLMMRPRLVIYNITPDSIRTVLARVALELDPDSDWAGDSLVMPTLGVQLAVEPYVGMRNVSLAAIGPEQDLDGWQKLHERLAAELEPVRVPVNAQGFSFLFLSILLGSAVIYTLVTGKQEIAHAVRQILRM